MSDKESDELEAEEETSRSKMKLSKRRDRGDYREPDYPYKVIPEIF